MSWEQVEIGKISNQVKTGKTPPTKETKYFKGDIKWFTPSDLYGQKYLREAKSTITQLAFDDNKAVKFEPNTLLINCIGDIGRVGIVEELCSSNQQLTGLVPKDNASVNYLYYWFIGNKKILEHYSNNAVVPILNNRTLNSIKIPLPPLPVQQRIAEILDTADRLRQADKKLLKKYDQLSESLFLEMFGDPATNPNGFNKTTIGNFLKEAKYGTSSKASETGKYPYLRMNNITFKGYMDFTNLKYIDIPDSDKEKYIVRNGDVLFNRTNSKELVGKTGLFSSSDEMIIAGYLIRLRVDHTKANPYYLWRHLNSRWAKQKLESMCKSIVGMANINAKEVQKIEILEAPLDLQNEFEAKVKEIENQKDHIKTNIKKSEDLFQSLLQKAFKGELIDEYNQVQT